MFSKDIRFDGSNDGLLSFINMMTGINGTVLDPDNPISQIKANKRNIHGMVKLVSNSVATTQLRVFKTKDRGVKSNFKYTQVRDVSEYRKQEMITKATPGTPLAQAQDLEEIVGGHPLVDLFRNVNSAWDNFGLKFVTTAYMSLTGDAYWVLLRNGFGMPAAIWIAPSEYMRIRPDEDVLVKEYVYKRGFNEVVFPPEDVIHFRLYAPGAQYQFHGRGDVAGAADAFNLAEAIQQFEQIVFDNQADMGGVLSTTSRTSPELQAKLLEQFEAGKTGIKNARKWMVMENVEPKPFGMTPRELDYGDSRENLSKEMLRNFGIPEAMWTGQSSTRAGLDTSLVQFALVSTLAFTTLMTEALNAQLSLQFSDNIIISFDNPVMIDKQFQMKRDSIDLKYGIKTVDEIRARDGLEPFGGLSAEPWHDSSRRPISMIGQESGDEEDQLRQVMALVDRAKERGA
jgi:HK97 family phage portal protein